MRAVLVATGESGREILSEQRPNSLLPLIDRPFIGHVLEAMAQAGIEEVDVILSRSPERIEAALGDGAPWGCRIRYHLTPDAARPYDVLKLLAHETAGPLLLAHAERLPLTDLTPPRRGLPCLYYDRAENGAIDEPSWTGWAWVRAEDLLSLPGELVEDAMEMSLLAQAVEGGRIEKIETVYDARSCEALLASQYVMLGRSNVMRFSAHCEIAPGVWAGRHTRIHSQANLYAPVFLGDGCIIEAGASIGPNVAIGERSVIGCGATLEDALLLPNSYLGEGLNVKQAVIGDRTLYNARDRILVEVTDRTILDDLAPAAPSVRLLDGLGWLLALSLFLATAPLVAATAFSLWVARGGPVWRRRTILAGRVDGPIEDWREVRLWMLTEAAVEARGWRGWLFRILPGLVHVLSGKLRLFGIRPRSAEEVCRLSPHWRRVYCRHALGLIPLGGDPVDEEWPLDLLGAVSAEMSS